MPTTKSNTCEGTNGTTVTTSNSAGPQQFDTVSVGTSAVVAYANSPVAQGSTSITLTNSALGGASVGYSASVTTSYKATWFQRFGTIPTGPIQFFYFFGTSDYLTVSTGGIVGVTTNNTQRGSGGTGLTAATWYTMALTISNISGLVGDFLLQVFDQTGTTLITSISVAGMALSGSPDRANWGPPISGTALTSNIDDVSYTDTLGQTASNAMVATASLSDTGFETKPGSNVMVAAAILSDTGFDTTTQAAPMAAAASITVIASVTESPPNSMVALASLSLSGVDTKIATSTMIATASLAFTAVVSPATYRPLVIIGSQVQQLPSGQKLASDTVPSGGAFPPCTLAAATYTVQSNTQVGYYKTISVGVGGSLVINGTLYSVR